MKKITATKDDITFNYDGSTVLQISAKPISVRDEVAKVAKERLGDSITVEDAGPDYEVRDGSDQKDVTTDETEGEGPNYVELKAKAKELGLSQAGKKDEIAERIAAFESEQANSNITTDETEAKPAADAEAAQ